MRSAKELSPKMQVSAELYRAVQQLSGPSPLGPGFLINTLLEEALRAPAIIDRARFLLAEALRQYAGELERRKDRAELASARRKELMDTLLDRIKRRPKGPPQPEDNVDAPKDTTQRHDTLALPIAPDPQQIQFFSWVQAQLKTTAINQPASSIHTHQDGLLLASPRIFQDFAEATNCSWRDCQKNVFKSDCIKTSGRYTIKRYRLAVRAKNKRDYLNCVVVRPESCKDLFGELPAPNPNIVERVSW